MLRPLDGVRFKLIRAQENADTLYNKIESFIEEKPYISTIDYDATWEFTLWLEARKEPDPYWGVYVGEFFHNVRSSLDHLMAALVRANGKRVTRQTQFPIFTDKCRFEVKGEPMMRGASPEARAVIQELQPYHRRDPEEHPLEILRVLSNKDKHQLLHAAVFALTDVEQRISQIVGSHRLQVLEVAKREPLKGKALVLRARVLPGADFENVKMHLQATGKVILGDGTRFEDCIEPVLYFVRDQVVPRLEGFVER